MEKPPLVLQHFFSAEGRKKMLLQFVLKRSKMRFLAPRRGEILGVWTHYGETPLVSQQSTTRGGFSNGMSLITIAGLLEMLRPASTWLQLSKCDSPHNTVTIAGALAIDGIAGILGLCILGWGGGRLHIGETIWADCIIAWLCYHPENCFVLIKFQYYQEETGVFLKIDFRNTRCILIGFRAFSTLQTVC